MAELQKQVSLEDVERLNDETAEAKEYQERVQEMLSQSLSAQDDAEALEELEEIQACLHPSILAAWPYSPPLLLHLAEEGLHRLRAFQSLLKQDYPSHLNDSWMEATRFHV